MKTEIDLNEMTNKIKYLEENLNKNDFSNPIRENLTEIRNELIEFANVFSEEMKEFEATMVR